MVKNENYLYDALCEYLRINELHLEKEMFRAVLKSLRVRDQGESARSANDWAFSTELVALTNGEYHSDKEKELRKDLASLGREVWKFAHKTEKS